MQMYFSTQMGGVSLPWFPWAFLIEGTVLTDDEWYKYPACLNSGGISLRSRSYWYEWTSTAHNCTFLIKVLILAAFSLHTYFPTPLPGFLGFPSASTTCMLPVSGWVPFRRFLWEEPRLIPRKPLIRQFGKYLPHSKETLRAIISLLSEDSSLNTVPHRIPSRSPDKPLNLYNFFWISPSSCQSYVENYYMWV